MTGFILDHTKPECACFEIEEKQLIIEVEIFTEKDEPMVRIMTRPTGNPGDDFRLTCTRESGSVQTGPSEDGKLQEKNYRELVLSLEKIVKQR